MTGRAEGQEDRVARAGLPKKVTFELKLGRSKGAMRMLEEELLKGPGAGTWLV